MHMCMRLYAIVCKLLCHSGFLSAYWTKILLSIGICVTKTTGSDSDAKLLARTTQLQFGVAGNHKSRLSTSRRYTFSLRPVTGSPQSLIARPVTGSPQPFTARPVTGSPQSFTARPITGSPQSFIARSHTITKYFRMHSLYDMVYFC